MPPFLSLYLLVTMIVLLRYLISPLRSFSLVHFNSNTNVNCMEKAQPANLLLTERIAPVRAPLVIEFQGSSFFLKYTIVQSIAENKPPQTAKFPTINLERTGYVTFEYYQ